MTIQPADQEPVRKTTKNDAVDDLWDELEEKSTKNGIVNLTSTLTDDFLDDVCHRVLAGDLPPGFVTTDPLHARRLLNRAELYHRWIRARRRVLNVDLRRYIPVFSPPPTSLPTSLPTNIIEFSRTAHPVLHRQTGDWTRSSDDLIAANTHATIRMNSHIDAAAFLHARTRVTLGLATIEQVRTEGHNRWNAACDYIAATTKRPAQSA